MPVAVFKKLKKSKDKDKDIGLPEPEPVKQVDSRTGFDSYRDFYTLKNYWKAVTRNKDAGVIMITRNSKCRQFEISDVFGQPKNKSCKLLSSGPKSPSRGNREGSARNPRDYRHFLPSYKTNPARPWETVSHTVLFPVA